MQWTIRNRMIGMGALVFVALTLLTAITYRGNSHIGVGLAENDLRVNQLQLLKDMQYAQLELTLAAMDAIIDRGDGEISSERTTLINERSDYLRIKVEAIQKAADTAEEKAEADKVAKGIELLTRTIKVDLKNLIESKAEDAAFGKIDDGIDQGSDNIRAGLASFTKSVQAEYKEANDGLNDDLASTTTTSVAVATATILIVLFLFILFAKSILGPTAMAVDFAEAVQRGDLSKRLKLMGRDEINQLCRSLDSAADALEEKACTAASIAEGNLTCATPLASENDSLGIALRTMRENLHSIVQQIREAVAQVSSGSSQISDASQSLSQGATESAASLEEITSSMTEIGSQTKHNAENASQANHLATAARSSAEKGSDEMKEMTIAMSEIASSAGEITKIIKTIDDIAFQTNLLALNAAVEAARAGRHGKGFAVVAEEVRNLAARSAKAAQETAQLIEESNSRVANGTQIANKTSVALVEIVEGITKASDLVGEIAAASSEQAQGISQVSQGLAQIDSVTQQNTANAEETASAAEELAGQAQALEGLVAQFKLHKAHHAPTDASQRRSIPLLAPAAMMDTGSQSNWGTAQSQNVSPVTRPAEMIALDDAEFGKY